MKKIIVMLIAAAMVLSLAVSCGDSENKTDEIGENVSSVQEVAVDEDLAAIIKNASQIGEGTAGQSLKYAELARDVASFAANRGFTDGAVEELKTTFEKTFEELDEDGRASVDAAFMNGVIPLLDKAIEEGKYDKVKKDFEDAGAADDMATILKTPGLDVSYRAIKSAYLTLGNSED